MEIRRLKSRLKKCYLTVLPGIAVDGGDILAARGQQMKLAVEDGHRVQLKGAKLGKFGGQKAETGQVRLARTENVQKPV
jgi:hypothetical protein